MISPAKDYDKYKVIELDALRVHVRKTVIFNYWLFWKDAWGFPGTDVAYLEAQ